MNVLTGAERANRPVVGKPVAYRLGHTPAELWAGVETRLTDDDSQKLFRSFLPQAAQEPEPGMLDDGTATGSFHAVVVRRRRGGLSREVREGGLARVRCSKCKQGLGRGFSLATPISHPLFLR